MYRLWLCMMSLMSEYAKGWHNSQSSDITALQIRVKSRLCELGKHFFMVFSKVRGPLTAKEHDSTCLDFSKRSSYGFGLESGNSVTARAIFFIIIMISMPGLLHLGLDSIHMYDIIIVTSLWLVSSTSTTDQSCLFSWHLSYFVRANDMNLRFCANIFTAAIYIHKSTVSYCNQ